MKYEKSEQQRKDDLASARGMAWGLGIGLSLYALGFLTFWMFFR